MNIIVICNELREMADSIPDDETVKLPATKVSHWFKPDDKSLFEDVYISELLRFLADMIE